MRFELAGYRVAVVGGSSGIGLETVRLAAEAGTEVHAGGRDEARRREAGEQPGTIETPMFDILRPEVRERATAERGAAVPLGRVGQPGEVAAMILSVALGPHVTGTTVDVDGGFLLP